MDDLVDEKTRLAKGIVRKLHGQPHAVAAEILKLWEIAGRNPSNSLDWKVMNTMLVAALEETRDYFTQADTVKEKVIYTGTRVLRGWTKEARKLAQS